MSVIFKEQPEVYGDVYRKLCFYCGQKMTLAAVAWSGWAGGGNGISTIIFFHPDCLLEFTIRVFRDLHEIRLKSK